MELIYIDHNWRELGEVKDYSLDYAYGRDENNFQLTTQDDNLRTGYYWYIPNSTMGGIIDEVVSNSEDIPVYRGRTLEGIIESFSVAQLESVAISTAESTTLITCGNSDVTFKGRPTDILTEVNRQLGNPFYIGDSTIESEGDIYAVVDKNTSLYQALRTIFEPNGIKPRAEIRDNKMYIYIEGSIDYSDGQTIDASNYGLTITKSIKIPNHLIGIYRKEGNTIVKHIYTDDEGVIQPYYVLDSNHDAPNHDEEYTRTGISEKVVTGLDEIVEVIEGGGTEKTYAVVTPLTASDGNTRFKNGVPFDWNEKVYDNYYRMTIVDGEEKYEHPEQIADYTQRDFSGQSDVWWRQHFVEYYHREYEQGYPIYVQYTLDDAQYTPVYTFAHARGHLPANWKNNYCKYYTKRVVDNVEYFDQVEGETVYEHHKQKKKPSDWNENRKSYYMKWKRYKWVIEGYYDGKRKSKETVYDSLRFAYINKTETFDKYFSSTKKYQKKKVKKASNTTWVIRRYEIFDGYATIEDIANWQKRKLSYFKWESGKYYYLAETDKKRAPKLYADLYVAKKTNLTLPSKSANVWEQGDFVKPEYEQGEIYREVEDNYGQLCREMLKRYDEILNQATSIEAKFESDNYDLDVGDVVGGTHPYINEVVRSTIQKKVIKITPDTVVATYEV